MLCCPLKLGVLNPAGASVADFAATLTSPVPSATDVTKRQAQRRIFLRWDMSMVVPPKEHRSLCSRDDNESTDPLTSNTQSCGLAIETQAWSQKSCTHANWIVQELFPSRSRKIL